MKQQKTVIYIASTFAILLWGMSYIWTDKLINLGIPIFYFVFVRILLAGIVLFLFNTASSRIKRIQRRDLPKFLLLSLCEPFIYFLCETYGLKETGSPTISAMVIATIPIFSIGAGILFFKEKINAINIAGILMSLVGIVMVAMAKGELHAVNTVPADRSSKRSRTCVHHKKPVRQLFQPDHRHVPVPHRFGIPPASFLMEGS